MVNKVNSCVFISGNGSNLKSIIKSSREYNFPIKIGLIISNKANARGIYYAKKYSIPYKIFSNLNQKDFERKSIYEIKKRKIKFLCLAGFLSILSDSFIKTFGFNIINIHPSLLPKYKGLNTHIRALKNNEKFSGCTVHYVNSNIDSGKIILQKKVKIIKNETVSSLSKKILKEEHKLYPKAINKIL